jgi:DNA-binding NtrC family response regulator
MSDKIHILVVDDEPDIRESFQEYLEINGYRASSADGAAEARRLVCGNTRISPSSWWHRPAM